MSKQQFNDRKAFHPADPPHGMQNYDIGALTRDQKHILNETKMIARRENEIYFKSHPEIKSFITILLRHVLSKRPLIDIPEVVGAFFNRPRREIVIDLLHHLCADGVDGARSNIINDLRREAFPECDVKTGVSGDSSSPSDYELCECINSGE